MFLDKLYWLAQWHEWHAHDELVSIRSESVQIIRLLQIRYTIHKDPLHDYYRSVT